MNIAQQVAWCNEAIKQVEQKQIWKSRVDGSIIRIDHVTGPGWNFVGYRKNYPDSTLPLPDLRQAHIKAFLEKFELAEENK